MSGFFIAGVCLLGLVAQSALPLSVELPSELLIVVEVATPLSSKTGINDQYFQIRLAEDVVIDGRVVVPAGTTGQGQIVHAAKARAMGKAGELILAARRIDCGTVSIPLRAFRLSGTGVSNTGGAMVASMAVPFAGVLVSGGNLEVPVGQRATAKVAAATKVPVGCSVL